MPGADQGISVWLMDTPTARTPRVGDGQVPPARLCGSDSHTSAAGAVGMFVIGVETRNGRRHGRDGFDIPFPCNRGLAANFATQWSRRAPVPEILRRWGVHGGCGAIVEFFGEVVETLATSGRATVADYRVGATAAVFSSGPTARRTAWIEADTTAT